MAYKCLDCGNIFEEGESWYEQHGERLSGCPCCGGGFEKTKQCKICCGEFLGDELLGGCVCDDCVEEYKRDLKTCYTIAETAPKEEIKINALLASVFDVTEIEEIL